MRNTFNQPKFADLFRELLVYEFELERNRYDDKPTDDALRACESWADVANLIDMEVI